MVQRRAGMFKYGSAEDCPDVGTHTAAPSGYLAWHAWAEEIGKTHTQTRCPTCGYWAVWIPKVPSV